MFSQFNQMNAIIHQRRCSTSQGFNLVYFHPIFTIVPDIFYRCVGARRINKPYIRYFLSCRDSTQVEIKINAFFGCYFLCGLPDSLNAQLRTPRMNMRKTIIDIDCVYVIYKITLQICNLFPWAFYRFACTLTEIVDKNVIE